MPPNQAADIIGAQSLASLLQVTQNFNRCVALRPGMPPAPLGSHILTIGLTPAGIALLTLARQSIHNHPKRLMAVVAALLLGAGGGAFALASLAPDASDLPVHQVMEAIQPAAPQSQTDALESQVFKLYRSDITRSSDTADTLLQRLGIDDGAAASFLRSDAQARQALLGRAGRNVSAETTNGNALLKLSARWSPDDSGQFKRLVVEKTDRGFVSRLEAAPLSATSRMASGMIQSSLFAATDDARIPDTVATQLAEIFSVDIDFRRALRKGDRFNVVYETLEADGEAIRSGRVLSAEFVNAGKTFQAMWFQPPGQDAAGLPNKGGYYTFDGKSLRHAYLSSPVEFSRISSGFSMRFHPILQKWRAHLGTDFAASTGTPARTVGDGVVEFSGVQNGYGNVVFIKHGNNQETVYAHLSKLMVQRGQRVNQGQTIGLVGATGWATGPHLHFEFRVGGKQLDPMTVARQSETIPLAAAAKPAFDLAASAFRLQLSAASSMQQVSAQ
jgi:murein DD-endopeptidase MepM/ murein hydrolase activator NlpD